MTTRSKWILLEHIGSPDDPKGRHFDLLLEDQNGCRSWRLEQIPVLDGPPQKVSPLSLHRLEWLEHIDGQVSGGRGWARRIMGGFFEGDLPAKECEPVKVKLHSNMLWGTLEIKDLFCKLCSVTSSTLY